jgi:hypothetical protein
MTPHGLLNAPERHVQLTLSRRLIPSPFPILAIQFQMLTLIVNYSDEIGTYLRHPTRTHAVRRSAFTKQDSVTLFHICIHNGSFCVVLAKLPTASCRPYRTQTRMSTATGPRQSILKDGWRTLLRHSDQAQILELCALCLGWITSLVF